MKWMIPVALLLAGAAYAQNGSQGSGQGSGQQQQQQTSFRGIPLPSGATVGSEEGSFNVSGPATSLRDQYRTRLESEGFTVTPHGKEEGREAWDVSKGDLRATVTIEEAAGGMTMIRIVPGTAGGSMEYK